VRRPPRRAPLRYTPRCPEGRHEFLHAVGRAFGRKKIQNDANGSLGNRWLNSQIGDDPADDFVHGFPLIRLRQQNILRTTAERIQDGDADLPPCVANSQRFLSGAQLQTGVFNGPAGRARSANPLAPHISARYEWNVGSFGATR
jgi:hypothetical protein